MKKTTLTITLSTLLAIFTFTACNNTKQEKMEDAKENIDEAKQDMKDAAQMDNTSTATSTTTTGTVSAADWSAYRADIDARIKANNDRISTLKARKAGPGKVLDASRQRRIDDLEARNFRLKQKLADYKVESGGWEAFKADVNKELDEMSKDLDDMSK